VLVDLIIKSWNVSNSGGFLSILVWRKGGVRGDGVNDTVAGGARHVVPVTLSVMESSILHGVCLWGGYRAGTSTCI